MKNKIVGLLVALTILGQVTSIANAINISGGTGESTTLLNQEQTNFKVTVPTSLPITVNSDGVVTTSTDVKIHNNSYGPVTISGIQIDVANGWSIVDFNKDMGKSLVGLKEFGFIIQGDEVQANGDVELTPTSWESIPGNGSMKLTYDAKVSPQKTALSDVNIANVVFILEWEEEVEPEEPSKYVLAKDSDFQWSNDSNGYTFDGQDNKGYWCYIGTDEYVEIPHVIQGGNITSYWQMFAGTSVKGVKSTNTNVTNMARMFYGSKATTLDLSSLDASSVTDMSLMLRDTAATTIDLSSFDTSNVVDMSYMFYGAQVINIDLSNLNTSNVTHMAGMFLNSKATTLDLSNFDTSKVIYMNNMFHNSSATTINLSSFDTSNVTVMQDMFNGSLVTNLDLSSFDTSKVTQMYNMFRDSKVTTLDLSSFVTINVTHISDMFLNSKATIGYARTQADADKLNSSSGKPAGLTFVTKVSDTGNTYVLATDADFNGKANGSFRYIGKAEYVEVPHTIKGIPVTSYSQMFQETSVKGVKSTNSNITQMSNMFYKSTATALDLSNLNTSSVTTMNYMFNQSKATNLDLSNFDTSKVTNMQGMFANSAATTLDLSNFNTSSVTNMKYMFQNYKATTLDLSSFDTSKATDMASMFYNATTKTGYARTQADANKFNASSSKPTGLTFIVK